MLNLGLLASVLAHCSKMLACRPLRKRGGVLLGGRSRREAIVSLAPTRVREVRASATKSWGGAL